METSKHSIYQIYYAPGQLHSLDPAFLPYDNSASERPQQHEFYVFQKEYLAGNTKDGITGFLSWKFEEKTGLDVAAFLRFCNKNPGRDVYFINPFPIEICYGNIWRQGEMWTPGITAIAQELLDQCGYGIDLASLPRQLRSMAYCNYWVGTPRFWDRYMAFCLPLYRWIHTNPDDPLSQRLLSMGDAGRKATYFSFIFERLFSTLLATDNSISYASYQYSRAELHERYPGCYANFLADLQELEELRPDDHEPVLHSRRHQHFLRRQDQAMRLLNRPWIRQRFNRGWPRWESSTLRQKTIKKHWLRKREMELFQLLNPAYVHWRRDLQGRG
jgi:hypothetical protein